MQELRRICTVTGLPFVITPLEQDLLQKFEAAIPTTHPVERLRRLAAFSNYLNLFHTTCAYTGDKIVSTFRPGVPFPVYRNEIWWSDAWDGLAYGRDYDFAGPFFEQFEALQNSVPQPALSVTYTTLENCEYINGASYSKNCYLIFHAGYNEDSCYCLHLWNSKDCIDCNSAFRSELCYDCTEIERCYDVRHVFNCKDCRECAWLWNCVGCQNCFGCVNLRQARFYWYNEQLTEAQYRRRLGAYCGDSAQHVEAERTRFHAFVKTHPQPALRGIETYGSTGDFLNHCANTSYCFDSTELRDCANCQRINSSHDCLDQYSFGTNCELIYNSCRSGYNSMNIRHSVLAYLNSADVEYCVFCASCKNCFACVGLHNKEFCIFNKYYPKAQYYDLKQRIISQMRDGRVQGGRPVYGEFFPYRLSQYAYNDSDAHFFFPLPRGEAQRRGARWAEEERHSQGATAVSRLPDRSSQADESLCGTALACPLSGRAFRISARELKLHQQRGIPLPREHWLVRISKREALKNPLMLHENVSTKSGRPLLTTFAPGCGWQVWDTEEFAGMFS